ncbi:MAG: peptide-methionine (R)-S-oxide reductase MsrB [Prochlorococcus sp.]
MPRPALLLSRRSMLLAAMAGVFGISWRPRMASAAARAEDSDWSLSNQQWRQRLSPQVYRVLREQGTERPFSSPLNKEKGTGQYHCAGCDLPLFSSSCKYDSGTGWPSFWQPLPEAIRTTLDFKLILPRREYHCRRCGGHQGHVFNDGPRPTGKRYCNNGIALTFSSDH